MMVPLRQLLDTRLYISTLTRDLYYWYLQILPSRDNDYCRAIPLPPPHNRTTLPTSTYLDQPNPRAPLTLEGYPTTQPAAKTDIRKSRGHCLGPTAGIQIKDILTQVISYDISKISAE